MFWQPAWYHWSHVSQIAPLSPQFTALSQVPHRYSLLSRFLVQCSNGCHLHLWAIRWLGKQGMFRSGHVVFFPIFCLLFNIHTIKWWYSLKQGDSLAKTKFVSSVPSSMSNIFGCSVRMVANRRRMWKVMTSLMMNFDLQVRLLTWMGVVGRSKLSSCIGEWSSLRFGWL